MTTRVIENSHNITTSSAAMTRHRESNGSYYDTRHYGYESGVQTRRVTGQSTPNYHKKLKNGDFIPYTYWRKFSAEGSAFPGKYAGYTAGGFIYSGDDRVRHEYKTVETDYDGLADPNYDLYIQEALAKVYAQGHDSLTFLAELGKTVRMFKQALPKLASLVSDIASGKVDPKVITNLWLETRYGWRTLIYDMQSLDKAINDLESERKFYSERKGETFTDVKDYELDILDNQHIKFTGQVLVERELSARGACALFIEPSRFRFNPIATGWEIVPYSFVIDWFFSVGSYIESMSALTFASNYSVANGSLLKIKKTVTVTATPKGSTKGTVLFPNPSVYTESLVTRQPTEVPNLPQFHVNLDEFKVLDLLSLVFQRVRR